MKLDQEGKEKALRDFGKRLDGLIYRRYRSKDLFIRETGFHKANLYDIINGEGDPRFSTLFRLANALDVTMEELMGKDKPANKEKPKKKTK